MHPVVEALKDFWIDAAPTGSRVICNPPVTDTDEDWVLLVEKWRMQKFEKALETYDDEAVFESEDYGGLKHFESIRLNLPTGELNLIVTHDREFFDKFVAATSVAKRLNLLKRDDRVALFSAVLYGEKC